MELGSLVAQAYRGTRQSVSAEMPQPPRDEAANPAGAAAAEFVRTLRESDATAMQSMTGSGDPHALVQALSQAELAVAEELLDAQPEMGALDRYARDQVLAVKHLVITLHVPEP